MAPSGPSEKADDKAHRNRENHDRGLGLSKHVAQNAPVKQVSEKSHHKNG